MTAPNVQPRFTKTPNISSALVDAANTNSDGTGNIATPTMYLLWTPGSQGGVPAFVRVMQTASTAGSTPNATVIRIYLSTVSSGATTNANTWLVAEQALPANTIDNTTTAGQYYDIPLGFQVPTGKVLLASTHVAAAANTHNLVQCFGGDF